MKTVLVLFGGVSNEYEVSLRSAAAVCRHLPKDIQTYLVGITKKGDWLLFSGDVAELENDTWLNYDALLSPLSVTLSRKGTCLRAGDTVLHPDVIFPVLHGQNCEDGRLQGFLDTLGIPYVGCGCAASVFGMDKANAKLIAQSVGVPVADWLLFSREEIVDGKTHEHCLCRIEERFPTYPVFIKAVNSGSSVGAFRADDRAALSKALLDAAKVDTRVLAEEFICGREIEVAVLENGGKLTVSVPGEIEPCAAFYDYDTKYKSTSARTYIPARLPSELLKTVSDYAATVFTALGCRHLSRVDFFVTGEGRVLFNEINTMPGFTSISMYPKLMETCGIPFSRLTELLIEEASRT